MEAVFLKIFNMSITAGWIALAVIVLRLLFRKAPKAISVFMWALVGIRLICPFSLESVLSLIPTSETVPSDILYSQTPTIQSGIPTLNAAVNPVITESLSPELGASVNPMQIVVFLASAVWVIGMAAMFLYTAISYLRLRFKVREAALLKDHIWICDHIDTPFIMGVIRPRIYLPSSMDEQDMEYVIAHEMAHLKRRDHLWKPLGFLLLTVYWFHPVLWLAYVLLCRDIELACDEKVIKEMGAAIKKPYSQALINCSVPRRMISACPLAFGEVGVKRRVKSVLNYKKPAFWLIVVAVIACIAASVCFLTDPKDEALPDETTDAATQNTTAGDGNNKDEAPPDETTDAAAQNTTAGDTNNVVTTEELDSLRMKYPLYFSCSTSKGLAVYIWQMAEHSYSCVLFPGSNSVYTQEDLWKFHTMATTLDEMRAIVASYQISPNDVTILPIQMWHSSYAYTIDEAYREKLTNLFWSDFPIIQASSDSSSQTVSTNN